MRRLPMTNFEKLCLLGLIGVTITLIAIGMDLARYYGMLW